MFLCLLLFTIKVSQGKFLSVLPPPPHTPWQVPTESSKYLAETRPFGIRFGRTCVCVRLSLCLFCGCTSLGTCSPPSVAVSLGLPHGHPRSRAGTRFSLKSTLRPPSALTQPVHRLVYFSAWILLAVIHRRNAISSKLD